MYRLNVYAANLGRSRDNEKRRLVDTQQIISTGFEWNSFPFKAFLLGFVAFCFALAGFAILLYQFFVLFEKQNISLNEINHGKALAMPDDLISLSKV